MDNHKQLLDVSWGGIFKIFLVGFLFYTLYLVREVLILFFFALIISFLVNPAINLLKKIKIPRIVGAAFIYLGIFGILGFLIYLTAPIFIVEFQQFSGSLPQYFQKIHPFLIGMGIAVQENLQEIIRDLSGRLEEVSSGILAALAFIFGGVFSTILILTTAFFLSLEEKGVERFLILLSPKKYENYIAELFRRCQRKVSGWFGARLLISIFVGLAIFVVFLLFNTRYAFTFALLSGVLNFIPYVGPLITGILMFVFIGVSDLWWKAVVVVILFVIIQQIDANVLTPILTSKIIGLPPAIVLLSLVVGAKIFGTLGVIFAIPIAGILYEFLKEFFQKRKSEEKKELGEIEEEAAEIL